MTALIDPHMLDMLVCPVTKAPLRYDPQTQELVSVKAKLAFPVRNGVPILLLKEARNLDA